MKHEKGKVDFKLAKKKWDQTCREDDEFKTIEASGQAARQVSRGQTQTTSGHNHASSNFGTVKSSAVGIENVAGGRRLLLEELDDCMASANGTIEDNGMKLALIKREPSQVVKDMVLRKAGDTLEQQVATMDSLCRAVAW